VHASLNAAVQERPRSPSHRSPRCPPRRSFVIHGEPALLFGGVAAGGGEASLVGILALAAAAAVAGDAGSFLLGRRLGRPFLELHGGRIGLSPAGLARVDGFFERHGGKAVFFGRFTGFFRAIVPFVAGRSGMALRRLVTFSALSALIWTATFVVIGYVFFGSVADAGQTATRIALAGVLLAIAGFTLRSWLTGSAHPATRRAESGTGRRAFRTRRPLPPRSREMPARAQRAGFA
jgi:membrane protein DedA with SNARE-associated domain